MDKPYLGIFIWIAVGLIIGAVLYFGFLAPKTPPAVPPVQNYSGTNQTITPPAQGQPTLDILVINAPSCPDCNGSGLSPTLLANALPTFNIKMGTARTIEADSSEAQALISKYNISALPTAILTPSGKLNDSFTSVWATSAGTIEADGKMVYRAVAAPYYDTTEKKLVGFVSGIAINATGCPECIDSSIFMDSLESLGNMKFSSKKVLLPSDPEAVALIAAHNITRLPALLLSEDAMAYVFFQQRVLPLVEYEKGWYVLRNLTPPYVDLTANNSVKGLVKAVYLVNDSCTLCFNVTQLSEYLSSSGGLYISNSTTYDISTPEAKALVKKYDIKAIPMMMYSPDASDYPAFPSAWVEINSTIESNGWFVFRSHQMLNEMVYQNISSG